MTARKTLHRRLISWEVLVVLATWTHPSWSVEERIDGEDPRDREVQAEAPARPKDMPLAVLPTPPSRELPPPRPAALEAIDRLLDDISSEDPARRAAAREALLQAKSDWVSGIERRLDRLADRADREAMKRLFQKLRDDAEAAGSDNHDYLEDVLAFPAPKDQVWKDLVQLLAASRMLTAIGSPDAARVHVFLYSRFGEFIRIDTQRQLDELGDRATAALIEARRHPARKIADWADRLLRLRKRDDPHEAVRTKDSTALSAILVALGRTRDPEVGQLLLSFAATDQPGVQHAARQGLALLGDVAAWQLRDAYLDITGRTPPRDWTWKRTARELFTEYDRLRLEEAFALYEQGSKAQAEGNLDEMVDAYIELVAKMPQFPKRNAVAEGFYQAATAMRRKEDWDATQLLALRAEQSAEDDGLRSRAEALRRFARAELLESQGWIDAVELERAVSLDPHLEAERSDASKAREASTWGARSRVLVGALVAGLSLLGAAWIFVTSFASARTAKGPER